MPMQSAYLPHNDGCLRRRRLLEKALESLPLAESLELARRAEEFLTEELKDRSICDEPTSNHPTEPEKGHVVLARVDEIVRYLRQQDDVVVSMGDGGFLVNGRFRDDLDQLIARANRIRKRRHLPQFVLTEAASLANQRQPLPASDSGLSAG
jgi:hypothetical protein